MAVGAYLLTERLSSNAGQSGEALASQLLRLVSSTGEKGADIDTLAAQTGYDAAVLYSILAGLEKDGLVENPEKRYRLTEFGAKALPLIR